MDLTKDMETMLANQAF